MSVSGQGRPDMDETKMSSRKKIAATKPTYLYVPANFDPDAVLPDNLKNHADSARYFLHRIIWGRMLKRTLPNDYVPLKWDYLRAVIPDRVLKSLKHALVAADVIECDNRYIEGHKSHGYRLCSPYREATIVRTAVKHRRTTERITKNRRADEKKVRLDVHLYLRRQFDRLDIDLPAALAFLAQRPDYETLKLPAEQIAAKDISFSVCRYGRVHTDVTRAARVLRNALHVEGQPLVGIDIKNSQPLFFALLLANYRARGNKTYTLMPFAKERRDPYEDIETLISSIVCPIVRNIEEEERQEEDKERSSVPPLLLPSNTTRITSDRLLEDKTPSGFTATTGSIPQSEAVNAQLSVDERRFLRLCEEGRLYEELMEITGTRIRQWAKEGFFELLFGKNSVTSAFKSAFTEAFPHVAEVARIHKRKDYRFLSRLLQNYESTVVINRVCRRLMTEHPAAPVFTIHDSVLTTAEYQADVGRIVRQEFASLGLVPSLHIEPYGSTEGGT
jgi:hypothetical protein